MGRLLYSVIASLDGYLADENGTFDWAAPGEEAHAFINDRERSVGTHLFGRRMYEVMRSWETVTDEPGTQPVMLDFARHWHDTDKVVYSRTLSEATTARTRIERAFDPTEVARLKASEPRDLSVGGPDLARHAFAAGLVDECLVFLAPVLVGGGKQAFPAGVRLGLELVEERRFRDGMTYARYRTRP